MWRFRAGRRIVFRMRRFVGSTLTSAWTCQAAARAAVLRAFKCVAAPCRSCAGVSVQNPQPIQLGIRPGAGRAVLTDEGNSGSRSGPLLLFPGAAQGKLGAAGASAFVVAAEGQFRPKGV